MRELFRFRRGDVTEAYGLEVVNPGAELWRVTFREDLVEKSERLHVFTNPQDALKMVQDMRDRFEKEGLLDRNRP